MNRIDEKFKTLLKSGSKALITYITAGDPDMETTIRLVPILEQSGADIIELGVPFSDPLADGTTIQRASQRSLQKGINLRAVLQAVEEIRTTSSLPLLLMSYYNPILRYGIERFVDHASEAGVDGAIVPDLPPEESGRFLTFSKSGGFDLIFLVAPTSTVRRMRLVNECSSGFIYCVSLTGVTGAREDICEGLDEFLQGVRAHTDKPLAVGFGISTPEQARKAARRADGIIVGSAIVDIIEKTRDRNCIERNIGNFVRDLKDGLRKEKMRC